MTSTIVTTRVVTTVTTQTVTDVTTQELSAEENEAIDAYTTLLDDGISRKKAVKTIGQLFDVSTDFLAWLGT